MKNRLQFALLVLLAVFILSGCQKDETDYELFSAISGKLIPGENVTSSDFSEMVVLLAKLGDGVNPETVTTKTEDMEPIAGSAIKPDGSFAFDSLESGNYVVALSEGFILAPDTFAVLAVDGEQTFSFGNKTVERIPEENFFGPTVYTVKYVNNSFLNLETVAIDFFVRGEVIKTITPEDIKNKIWGKDKFDVELNMDLDPKFSVTLQKKSDGQEFTSEPMYFFKNTYHLDYETPQNLLVILNGSSGDDDYIRLIVEKSWFFGHKIEVKGEID